MRTMRRTWLAAALVVGASVGLVACGGGGATDEAVPADPQAAAGQAIAQRTCLGCHSTDGSSGSGPTFEGLYGSQRTLEDGSTVVADDAYLTTAIRNPDAQIVEGYSAGIMSAVVPENEITPEQTEQLIAYIRGLEDPRVADPTQ